MFTFLLQIRMRKWYKLKKNIYFLLINCNFSKNFFTRHLTNSFNFKKNSCSLIEFRKEKKLLYFKEWSNFILIQYNSEIDFQGNNRIKKDIFIYEFSFTFLETLSNFVVIEHNRYR